MYVCMYVRVARMRVCVRSVYVRTHVCMFLCYVWEDELCMPVRGFVCGYLGFSILITYICGQFHLNLPVYHDIYYCIWNVDKK